MTMQGPKVVLGPGTGLGEAQLFWDDVQGGYRVWPSEGSHACFAPRGWKQRALQARRLPAPFSCACGPSITPPCHGAAWDKALPSATKHTI